MVRLYGKPSFDTARRFYNSLGRDGAMWGSVPRDTRRSQPAQPQRSEKRPAKGRQKQLADEDPQPAKTRKTDKAGGHRSRKRKKPDDDDEFIP
ncbi:unnamed protein product [Vitrella brassicaformis CCMP3155]|uniref:Uncharacterized protein n=1 Tax=Vitrella brassicaformis (strain CCMP3155) TaxID=1169540 RepID=A0A0G4E9Q2_VITBC|nr:unnamed protein product [Vitrella brassicaformis CCMP3155]|eukprot:CEL91911.1 unnamed protein product [Vitrella brassicaformis CCMP3155]